MFRHVLAATARPLECDESVLSGLHIARGDNARLTLLHVVESDSIIYRNYVKHYRSGEEIVCDASYRETVREALQSSCRDDLAPSDRCEIRVAQGVPWAEILKTARDEEVDLIVLGSHTGKSRSVGMTAEKIIKHERCPVMIVNHPIPQDRRLFERILVGIDFSPSCRSAFEFALRNDGRRTADGTLAIRPRNRVRYRSVSSRSRTR